MTNDRTDILLKHYKPELAIVVYKSLHNDYYLESHSMDEKGQVMEGKPLLQETIQGMVDVFFDEKKNMQDVKGLIPENVLSFQLLPGGNYKMVWYRPAEKRVMHHASQLKLPSEQTWVPAMLYKADGKTLDVFALKSNTRPSESTKLFRAPFYNVNSDGDVCLGNAKVLKPKEKTYINLMKYWEDLFWLSEFSHVNGSGIVKTDPQKVWKKLLISKCKLKFDTNELVATKLTLKTFIK